MTTALASVCAGCGRAGPMRSCRDNVSGREVPVCDATPLECAARIPLVPSLTPQARRGGDMEAADERWAATVSEAVFQERVLATARRWGWLYYHTHDSRRSAAGFPDLALAHESRGQLLLVELKREREKLKPAQATWGRVLGAVFVRSRGHAADEHDIWPPAFIYAVWRPSDLPAITKLLSGGEEAA